MTTSFRDENPYASPQEIVQAKLSRPALRQTSEWKSWEIWLLVVISAAALILLGVAISYETYARTLLQSIRG
jgi:anti-sigma-K factor RskA